MFRRQPETHAVITARSFGRGGDNVQPVLGQKPLAIDHAVTGIEPGQARPVMRRGIHVGGALQGPRLVDLQDRGIHAQRFEHHFAQAADLGGHVLAQLLLHRMRGQDGIAAHVLPVRTGRVQALACGREMRHVGLGEQHLRIGVEAVIEFGNGEAAGHAQQVLDRDILIIGADSGEGRHRALGLDVDPAFMLQPPGQGGHRALGHRPAMKAGVTAGARRIALGHQAPLVQNRDAQRVARIVPGIPEGRVDGGIQGRNIEPALAQRGIQLQRLEVLFHRHGQVGVETAGVMHQRAAQPVAPDGTLLPEQAKHAGADFARLGVDLDVDQVSRPAQQRVDIDRLRKIAVQSRHEGQRADLFGRDAGARGQVDLPQGRQVEGGDAADQDDSGRTGQDAFQHVFPLMDAVTMPVRTPCRNRVPGAP